MRLKNDELVDDEEVVKAMKRPTMVQHSVNLEIVNEIQM